MTIYINYNGKYYPTNEKIFSSSNRVFQYGDGIFETIKAAYGRPANIENHYQRLVSSAETLKLILPYHFNPDIFNDQITALLKKNLHLPAARVRYTLFRNDGGLYQPKTNEVQYLIQSSPLENNNYELNEEGLKVGVYYENKKMQSPLSKIKSCNALLYVMAKKFATENGFDDCFILNNCNNPVEATSSNLFVVNKNTIYTPPLSEGCVAGTMRQMLINMTNKWDIEIVEIPIKENQLDEADEIFLTNAISGIKWVCKCKQKKYTNKTSLFIIEKLNDSLR